MTYRQSPQLSPYNTNHSGGNPLYKKVMIWVAAQFAVMAFGIFAIGPLLPPTFVMPLYLILLSALIFSAFTRVSPVVTKFMAIIVPLILGITLYRTLEMFMAVGAGDIILLSALGTIVIFTVMAVIGYTSSKSLESWSGKLFAIVLGVIALSLLNAFIFKMAVLNLAISVVVLIAFSIYIFIDIQRIRDSKDSNNAAGYALDLFLNIYNIFASLLNILSFFRS